MIHKWRVVAICFQLASIFLSACGAGQTLEPIVTTTPTGTITHTLTIPPMQTSEAVSDVEGWAVLISKENYIDTGRPITSNIPTRFLGLHRLHSLLSYFGWQESHILEIRDEITQDSLVSSLEWLKQNADKNDVAFFYIEAHGGFLENDLQWEYIFPRYWRQISSERRLLVVSSCNAERFTKVMNADPFPHISIAAVSEDELGWGGIWYEGLPIIGIVFSYYFIQAFTSPQADIDGDWVVSVQEAAIYANAYQSQYMHEVVYHIPAYLQKEEQVVDNESPHVVVDDQAGEPVYLDLDAYSFLPILATRRAWSAIEPRVVEDYAGYRTLSLAPDGTQLAYLGSDEKIHIINLPNLEEIAQISPGMNLDIRRLTWSEDGKQLAVLGINLLQVWMIGSVQPQNSVDFSGMDLRSLAWSPDGNLLAIGDTTASVMILVSSTMTQERILDGYQAEDIAWSPSGQLLAGGGEDGVWVWDTTTNGQLFRFEECAAIDISWSPNGTRLAASCEGIVHVWDVINGNELLQLDHWAGMESIDWSPDSTQIAAGTLDGFTKIWDVSTGEVVGSMRDYVYSVDGIAWSADGRFLISAGYIDGVIRIWEVP